MLFPRKKYLKIYSYDASSYFNKYTIFKTYITIASSFALWKSRMICVTHKSIKNGQTPKWYLNIPKIANGCDEEKVLLKNYTEHVFLIKTTYIE